MRAFIAFISLILGLWLFRGDLLFLCLLSGAWLVYIFWRFSKTALTLGLLFFACGMGIGAVKIPVDMNQKTFTGMVVDAKDNYFLLKNGLQKYYVYEKNCTRESGDILTIEGSLSSLHFYTVESQFDFEEFLSRKGVAAQLYPKTVKTHFEMPLRTRTIQHHFLSRFEPETRNLLGGLLFGNMEDESGVGKAMNDLRLQHLFSTSGIHLSFWLQAMTYFLGLKVKEKWARIGALVSLLPLSIFTIGKISVFRVMASNLLRWLNEYQWNKKFDSLTLLCTLGVICCLSSRYIVYSESFLLSFSIPILLILSRNAILTFPKRKRAWLSPIIILVFVIPFQILDTFEVHLLTFFAQILLTPLVLLAFMLGIISFYFLPLVGLLNLMTHFIVFLLQTFASMDLRWILGKPSLFFVVFYFMFLFGLLCAVEAKHRKRGAVFAGLLGLTLAMQSVPIEITLTRSVNFINVGQGDSILIRDKKWTVLVDTGGSLYFDVANDCLIPYFKKQKITHIDYLITTHDDYDHNGGAEELMSRFSIKNYVTEKSDFPLRVGGLTFINLNEDLSPQEDENSASLVLSLDFMNRKWLFMGDAPVAVEKEILKKYPDLDTDVLKVGHHGSDTSSSDAFLAQITPEVAIVSVGKNSFGHPSKEILAALVETGAEIRRTDLEGTISYTEWAF